MGKKGFAVSGIIYSLMILFIILVIALLSMFNSRKNTLDKLKDKVLNQIGSDINIEPAIYEKNSEKQHKVVSKGYYSITLTSSNGSTLQSELYLNKGEILYLKIDKNETGIYIDKNLQKLLLKVTNNDYKKDDFYKDKIILNTTYTLKNDPIEDGNISFTFLQRNRKNDNMRQVRYIKNCTSGNNYKWTEIMAIVNGINIAQNGEAKIYKGVDEIIGNYVIDNNLKTFNETSSETKENVCVIVDLKRTYDLDYIYVWHEYDNEIVYYDNKTYTSTAGIDYKLIDNYDVKENSGGKYISGFEPTKVKLVGSVYVPVKIFDGATWIRLYHHNSIVNWEARNQVLMENGYDSIHKKSILYHLKDYLINNKYELMLEYPDISDIKYNRWTQTSDFTVEDSVKNYKAIHIDYSNFYGLMSNEGINSIITTTDGKHYAIGTKNGIVYGSDDNPVIGSTDLWIRIN